MKSINVFMASLALVLFFFLKIATAQDGKEPHAHFNFDNGLGVVSPDSTYEVNIRFRMQNYAGLSTASGSNLSINDIEAEVKRLRLCFNGFVLNEKIKYLVQLSFSHNDMSGDYTKGPNIIKDAIINYHFNPRLNIGLGYTKLPGSRQYIISSGSQQFIERSVVSGTYNIGRDFGFYANYSNALGFLAYNLKTAITTGDGRGVITNDKGLAYTGRLELLPLGHFTDKGDFFEGDLSREPSPKIAIGAGYAFNKNAGMTRDKSGDALFEKRNMEVFYGDFLLKYGGFSLSSEYSNRQTHDPFTISSENDTSMVVVGFGLNTQLSYLFRNNFEVAFRYAFTEPHKWVRLYEQDNNSYVLGFTKYLNAHKLKVQSNISYNYLKMYQTSTAPVTKKDKWMLQFLVELGI